MTTKQELRNLAKNERKKLDIETLSKDLVGKLKLTDEYINAKNIMIFYPKDNEINLLELLEDKSKNFYLPKINGENLLCCPYDLGDELCESCFKTKEPISEPTEKSLIDLIIVPALAVDKNNYRLGYGGGFYDRFLANVKCKKIICIPRELVFKTVLPENHDIKIEKIITT